MKKDFDFVINKKYPKYWSDFNEKEKIKKEEEFNVVSFFLNNYSPVRELFHKTNNICVEFYEGPDFLVSLDEDSYEKIGLEITCCFADKKRNALSLYSDLKKLCEEVIRNINKTENRNFYQDINYINVTFTHKVMIGELYDKNKLKSELKDFIICKNKHDGEYVSHVETGYSVVYHNLNISVYFDMMYIVPRICDVVQIQKEKGDPVMLCIAEKEKKLACYKQNCKFSVHEWWLCIDVPKSAFMNPVSYHLPEKFTSEYDKIFLITQSIYGYGVFLIYGR